MYKYYIYVYICVIASYCLCVYTSAYGTVSLCSVPALRVLYVILCICAVDHSRVVLSVPDESGSDYINASYIDVSDHASN